MSFLFGCNLNHRNIVNLMMLLYPGMNNDNDNRHAPNTSKDGFTLHASSVPDAIFFGTDWNCNMNI